MDLLLASFTFLGSFFGSWTFALIRWLKTPPLQKKKAIEILKEENKVHEEYLSLRNYLQGEN